MSHTPGPWSYQTFTRLKEGDKPMQIITAGNGTGWKGEQYMNVTGIISEADAKLIAAAPEMLDALIALVAEYEIEMSDWPILDNCPAYVAARKVIAKAKGES